MKKPQWWQERYVRLLSKYIDIEKEEIIDPEFAEKLSVAASNIDKVNSESFLTGRGLNPIMDFMRSYGFPDAVYDFIYCLATTSTMQPQLIGSGVIVVSEIDQTAIDGAEGDAWGRYYRNKVELDDTFVSTELKIMLNSDVTPTHLSKFVREESVRTFIKEKQILIAEKNSVRKRIKRSPNRRRDLAIKELANQDMSYEKIARQINEQFSGGAPLSYNDIATIIHRLKK